MNMNPLAELISGHGFDRFQPGLNARFKGYGFVYNLTYCEPTEDPTMRLDFESPLHFGRVTAWESGACDLEVIEIQTGKVVFFEHHELSSESEFHNILPKLVLFMRDATDWPKAMT